MEYKGFIKGLQQFPEKNVSPKIWTRIANSLWPKLVLLPTFRNFWPTATVAGLAAAVFIVISFNLISLYQLNSYFKTIESTQYIYEGCKYPG